MKMQIAIIGLGQIGTSIGLALAEQHEILDRIGHDREVKIARQAEKINAIDHAEPNLIKAVRDANLVLLSLPVDQIKETMALIAPELKEGSVVMDTGPIKGTVDTWAQELLSDGRHYVGLTPVIGPAYLHTADSGLSAAEPDLFRGGLMAIVAPPRTNSEAIKLAADLARLLGAVPMFADPIEMDGLMAATHLLPQLTAAALLNATIDQPGWREGRKVAGKAYAEATGPIVHLDDAHALMTSALLNRENALRVIDGTIAALQAIRSDIKEKNERNLEERLGRARAGREVWWNGRKTADWITEDLHTAEMPESQGILGHLFGSGWKSATKNRKE